MNGVFSEIPLAVVGCDFRVASSAWRSKLVLSDEQALAQALKQNQAIDGFCDLNTCNRNEWIVSGKDPQWAAALLRSQMCERAGPETRGWFSPYVFIGDEAAAHVLRVAAGQESLVLGERQISGQLYDALEHARERGISSRVLNGLGTAAGRLVRMALRQGLLGGNSVGVHSLAVAYIMKWLGPDKKTQVALVGLGEIGRRVLGLLEQRPTLATVTFNRTIKNSKVRGLDQLPQALSEVDAAIVCTGAPQPVIRPEDIGQRPADRPLLILDIGIPEQVVRAKAPENVTISGLDELTAFYKGNRTTQNGVESRELEQLVQKALGEFRIFCKQETFTEIIDTVQRNHSQLVHEEIPKVISNRLGYLPENVRAHVEQDLKAIVLGYTSDVFKTIRQASEKIGEGTWKEES
ncbi:MAG: hypothetical protein Q8O03_07195 [Nanoarchaeota archaeon]|nr:hypothetical protein [Nanoarchaeota archaeon]